MTTNTQEQMDVDEFLNNFFDQLENQLKIINKESIINDNFAGTLCNEVTGNNCHHTSNRQEPY